MKLAIHLLTYNNEKYIPYLFDSLANQSFQDWELFVMDNGSNDQVVLEIKNQITNIKNQVHVVESKENLGFVGGHNTLVQSSEFGVQSEYMLLLNQDMYLMPDCLEKMVVFLDENNDVAVVSPRLMKWDFDKVQSSEFGVQRNSSPHSSLVRDRINLSLTDRIDSLGLKVFRSRRVVEIGAGELWTNNPFNKSTNQRLDVFGVSGALPMFRRSVLEAVAFLDGSLFDSKYFMYKEDVDLAFRLRSAGFSSAVLPDAVAYHDRTASESNVSVSKNKKIQPTHVKYHSYKNHLMTLYKNEYWQNGVLDFPLIFFYELKKFVWFLLFDRSVLSGLGEIWKNRKDLKRKRKEIVGKRKLSWKEMRIKF